MSNLQIVFLCMFISFLVCAVCMSSFNQDQKDKFHAIDFNISGLWKSIRTYNEEIAILRAKIYDLENRIKEMEKLDDGK